MLDLADQLRSELRAAVDDLSPSRDLDGVVRRRVRQRVRRRRLTAAGAVASAAAAVLLVALVSPGGGDAPEVVAGRGTPAQTDVLYLVPDPVPEGYSLLHASGGDRPGVGTEVTVDPEWDRTQRYVRFDDSGERPESVIDVRWGPVSQADDPLAPYRTEPDAAPAMVRGHDGLASATGGWVVWEEPVGTVVLVTGEMAVPGGDQSVGAPLDPELVVTFAEGVVSSGDERSSEPPDGFELVAEWPGTASTGTNPRAVVYEDATGSPFQVHVADDSDLPPGISLGASDARRVDVDGHEAVLTPRLVAEPGERAGVTAGLSSADVFVQWVEPGGAQVTVSGVGLGEDEILAVARSLIPIDADAWQALKDQLDPGTGTTLPTDAAPPPPDTAGPAEEPATEEPAAGSPPSGALHVEGTYTGTEHYGFTTGDCPDLDHVLDATFELNDGTAWQFHSDYCGEVEGDTWASSSGTFTFTTPDGSTITGVTVVEPLQVPTPGVPQVLTVTGGTGDHAGASGSCDLEVNLTPVQLGVQEHAGAFTCDVTA